MNQYSADPGPSTYFSDPLIPSRVSGSVAPSATEPSSHRRSQALLAQPGHAGVGDLAPAVVDGQGVTTVAELLQVGDGGGVPVLLHRGLGDGLGHGVVLAAHH